MNNDDRSVLLERLAEELELPDSAYEAAAKRYASIGKWFDRDDSACAKYKPHIFPQGSFALGTAIRPINPGDAYDVDLACSLTNGLSKKNVSQEDLKELVGNELDSYRKANGIAAPLESKHRCWSLSYADDLKFHADIVPCIPKSEIGRAVLAERMTSAGIDALLAQKVAKLAVSITDDRLESFPVISDHWLPSNPQGYVKWFESRMRDGNPSRQILMDQAKVDDLPNYRRKSHLQRTIQILKRHRDVMFAGARNSKPISIIITTLVAENHSSATSLAESLQQAVGVLTEFVDSGTNEVRNPINPAENFADKWTEPEYAELRLKEFFHLWVRRLSTHLENLRSGDNRELLIENLSSNFATQISPADLNPLFGSSMGSLVTSKPVREIQSVSSKPWNNVRS